MATSLLFTGHMIDLPERAEPRFPASLEDAVRTRIAKAVERYAPDATAQSKRPETSTILGFASGARGGDILFHEECRRRQIDTVIVLPFEADEFVKSSVEGIPGADWPTRFWHLWNATPPERRQVLGLPPSDQAAYAICNHHLLEMARRRGRVHLVALWDGKEGDGPGGTADLVSKMRAENEPDVFSPRDIQS
jgi:hypothetical protein